MKSLGIKITKIILWLFVVVVIGFISAIFGFIVFVNVGFLLVPGFVLFGAQGYEATGPIGFVLGALIGLFGSSLLLFRKRTTK